jgi:tRNA(Ser,Leu) C12 N-acetylase TAN1
MTFNILEIIALLGGSTGITALLMLQIQRRKAKAEAGQEEGKEKAEHANAQKITDEVYALMSVRLKEQFEEMTKEIEQLQETQTQLKFTVKLQTDQITYLEMVVKEYKETCDNCKFRIETKKK